MYTPNAILRNIGAAGPSGTLSFLEASTDGFEFVSLSLAV